MSPRDVPLTVDDYKRLARERLEPAVWDFIVGGSGSERTVAANEAAFDRARLLPRVLTGSAPGPASTKILRRRWSAPIAVAPMAYHSLAHPEGELATVQGAGAAGLPVVVSTFATRSFEELAAQAASPLWLQVYCFRDRSITRRLIERAEQAGFEAIVLTVDVPRLGRRLRDLRNGFRLPRGMTPANLPAADYSSPEAHARTEIEPCLDWSVMEWLRSTTDLPILLKGVLDPTDARRAVDAGARGVVVSNHGGRQLDGAPATLDVLPAVAREVSGDCVVIVDGGIRRGTDVLVALASGADAVLLGRPVLYGLAVAGREGVSQVLRTLMDELSDAMVLTGATSLADVDGRFLSAPARQTLDIRPRHGGGRTEWTESGGVLRKEHLHASLADPVLESMTFLNEVTARYPDAVSFAPGRPYEEFFDTADMFDWLHRFLDHLAERGASPADVRRTLHQYGPTAGFIRELIAESLSVDEGMEVRAESIVVTVGCQEAMVLAIRALISGPEDVLLVSSPCYVGILGAARLLDITVVPVDEGEGGGPSLSRLDEVVAEQRRRGRRPRALYLVPDFANPTGATMSLEARRGLLAAAAHLDLLILEDSPYRAVSAGTRLPTLKALDRDARVVFLGSFAKSVFPGTRTGFVVADQEVRDQGGRSTLLADELAKIKSMVTVNTPSLSQAVVAGMLLSVDGRLADANAQSAAHYAQTMKRALDCLESRFPPERREALGVRWNAPEGGFFLSLHVPFRADEDALARSAAEYGVIWTPMSYFYPQSGGSHAIRLSISYLAPSGVEEGIARLARFIEAEAVKAATILQEIR